jgi:glycosyltransferase involved in cell wall biosynthesis
MPEISVVVPTFNESGSVRELCGRVCAELDALGRGFEILFVNDGSTDGTAEILDELAATNERVGVIHFRGNFGKAAALDAGFRQARGAIVITMDADLQDEPAELAALIAELESGYDVVSGWKKKRHDPLSKRLPSKLFNLVVRLTSGVRLHDFNCGFKAYRAEAVHNLPMYGELHRYVPVLVAARGFRVGEMVVKHNPRRSGVSKYGVKRYAKGFFDLLTVILNTRYRSRPLHLFGLFGLAAGGLGVAILAYMTVLRFLGYGIGTRPLFFLGILLLVLGVQLVSTGLLGEMIAGGQQNGGGSYEIRERRLPRKAEPDRLLRKR